MRKPELLGAVLMLSSTLTRGAECDQNLAGEWSREAAGPTSEDDYRAEGSGWSDRLRLTQDGARVTVESFYFSRGDLQPPLKFTYLPGGAATENVVMVGQGAQRQVSSSRWSDCRLVITTRFPAEGALAEATVTQTLWLEGSALVVETARGTAGANRTLYRKAAPAGGK
jgi:hypothetical protein